MGFLGLQNNGTLAPGITVIYPLASPDASQPQGAAATMAISGTLTTGPTGRLEIPLIGSGAGQYGSLVVTGTVTLDGVLALDFSNGYAPSQGDTFALLTAVDGLTGTFDSVAISGLMPGFEYEISYANGQLVFEALNDGVALHTLFLPLLLR